MTIAAVWMHGSCAASLFAFLASHQKHTTHDIYSIYGAAQLILCRQENASAKILSLNKLYVPLCVALFGNTAFFHAQP